MKFLFWSRREFQDKLIQACKDGDVRLLKQMKRNKKSANFNLPDIRYGATPMYYAAQHGRADVVRFLLEQSSRVDLNAEITPPELLTHVDMEPHLFINDDTDKEVIFANLNDAPNAAAAAAAATTTTTTSSPSPSPVNLYTAPLLNQGFQQPTPIRRHQHHAAAAPSSSFLLARPGNPSPSIQTNLHLHHNTTSAKLTRSHPTNTLSSLSAKPLFIDDSRMPSPRYRAPLHIACARGHLSVVKLLLADERIDANKMVNGYTPLHAAVSNGQSHVVDYLLAHPKVDVNAKDQRGDTILHHACRNGNVQLVEKLVRHPRGKVYICNNCQEYPMEIAYQLREMKIVKLLHEHPDMNEVYHQH